MVRGLELGFRNAMSLIFETLEVTRELTFCCIMTYMCSVGRHVERFYVGQGVSVIRRVELEDKNTNEQQITVIGNYSEDIQWFVN